RVAIARASGGEARLDGDVDEGAVAAIAEQAVGAGRAGRLGREGPALHRVDVEPAVAVVVEQAEASRHRLGELPPSGSAVVEKEPQPRNLGVVHAGGRGDRARPDG